MVIQSAVARKIPHSRVDQRDTLYFMEKDSETVSEKAHAINLINHAKLPDDEITKAIEDNNDKLNLLDKQKTRWHKKCLCMVEFDNIEEIELLDFDHQSNMDDWLIIEKIEDLLVETSIPYDYKKIRLKYFIIKELL